MALTPLLLLGALSAVANGQYFPPQPSKPSRIEDVPALVSLHTDKSPVCAGSILDEIHVLTTARCGNELIGSSSFVRSGSSLVTSGGQTHSISNITVHPSYSRRTLDYDVAVITINSTVPFNSSDKVQLANSTYEELRNFQPLSVYGWGTGQEFELQTKGPPAVEVLPFVNRDDCNRFLVGSFSRVKPVTEHMLCTQINPRYGKIANFGSPLLTESKEQVAISSWHRNRSEDIYIMHTDLTNTEIRDFITKILQD